MPFSPILSVLVCLTSAAVFAACVLFIRSARHRAILHELLAHPARQALAVFAAATLGAALLSAMPIDRDGRTDTLLQATIEATGAGLPEMSASAPFAVVDDHGRQLMHAGERLSSETPPLIHIIKYTLVALIAGGVTSFASILFTAAIIGARKGQNLATGITMLSSFYWRPGDRALDDSHVAPAALARLARAGHHGCGHGRHGDGRWTSSLGHLRGLLVPCLRLLAQHQGLSGRISIRLQNRPPLVSRTRRESLY